MRPEEQIPGLPPAGASRSSVREQDKIMLVLAYLGILALVPLLTVNDSDYVKWHAKNGLVLGFGGGFALMILAWIPLIQFIAICVGMPALLVISLIAMMKALKGERWRIPVVAELADKF